MNRQIFKDIFRQLVQIGIIDDQGAMRVSYMRFSSEGLMDLHVDKLFGSRISVAHNGVQNGDIMCDPDMEITIYPSQQEASAETYQNDYVGVYQEPEDKKELNTFLHEWLTNILEAKYELVETEE